jgi:ferredoxin
MAKVTFAPDGQVVECADGSTLFDAGGRAGVTIDTACVGKGTCGLCRVKVVSGGDALTPYTEEEERHLGNLYHLTRMRLACRTRVHGEVTVEPAARKPKAAPKVLGRGPPRR